MIEAWVTIKIHANKNTEGLEPHRYTWCDIFRFKGLGEAKDVFDKLLKFMDLAKNEKV